MKKFEKAYYAPDHVKAREATLRRAGVAEQTIREQMDALVAQESFLNDVYQVDRLPITHTDPDMPTLFRLSIKRRDKAPIFRDWRHFQQIKNELLGPECEAIELYPAESRLVDSANQYWLYGFADPTFRFPFGFNERLVGGPDEAKAMGATQRPFEVAP